MDRERLHNEIVIFFKVSAELREIIRKPKPKVRELRWSLDEIALMATRFQQPRVASRCRAILEELAPRFDRARLLLSELDARVEVYC